MIYDDYDEALRIQAQKSNDPTAAFLLYKIMSEISGEHFKAGWLSTLEFSLWGIMNNWDPKNPTTYGLYPIHQQDVDHLRYLSGKCQGWWRWDDDDDNCIFLSLEDWEKIAESDWLNDLVEKAAKTTRSH